MVTDAEHSIGTRDCSVQNIQRLKEQANESSLQPSLVLIVPLRQQCASTSGEERSGGMEILSSLFGEEERAEEEGEKGTGKVPGNTWTRRTGGIRRRT